MPSTFLTRLSDIKTVPYAVGVAKLNAIAPGAWFSAHENMHSAQADTGERQVLVVAAHKCFAVVVYDRDGEMIDRFNIARP